MESADPTAERLRVKLQQGTNQLSLHLSDHQYALLVQFLQILHKWNKVYNLTAVRSIDEMVGRHILDSLSILKWMPPTASLVNTEHADVLDVGTGAGLPVIPLAIMRPELRFVSVESNGKKTRFQQQALQELGLDNVRIEQSRIEDVDELATVVVSRAFTAPENFLRIIQKNCVTQSQVIIMLGTKERMPTALPSEFSLVDLQHIEVPQFDSTRHVAICQRN